MPRSVLDQHAALRPGEWPQEVGADRPDPISEWTDRRVALLGDAAHPSLHYLAQGACQALEDAVLPGDLLGCATELIPDRLTRYCELRREQTSRIQLTARDSIRLWHPAGAAAATRNSVLAAISTTELHDHLAWLYRPRPTTVATGTARTR